MMFDLLVTKYVVWFSCGGEPVLKSLINCEVPTRILIEKYNTLELIGEDQWPHLLAYGKELLPDADEGKIIKFAKITHTIGTLL